MVYEHIGEQAAEDGLSALDKAAYAFDSQLTDPKLAARGQSLGVEMRTDSPVFNPYFYWSLCAEVAEEEHAVALERGDDPEQADLTLLLAITARNLLDEQWLIDHRNASRPSTTAVGTGALERVRDYHALMRRVARSGLDVPVRDLLLALGKPVSMVEAAPGSRAAGIRLLETLVHRIQHEDALAEMLEYQGYEVVLQEPVHTFADGTMKAREKGGPWITIVLDARLHTITGEDPRLHLYRPDPNGRRMVYFHTGLSNAAFAGHFRLPDPGFQHQAGLVGTQFQEVCDRFRGSNERPVVWRSGS